MGWIENISLIISDLRVDGQLFIYNRNMDHPPTHYIDKTKELGVR